MIRSNHSVDQIVEHIKDFTTNLSRIRHIFKIPTACRFVFEAETEIPLRA